MSKLDNIFESKAMQKLQAIGGAVQANKTVSAITNSMMCTLGILLCGAVFVVIASVLNAVGLIAADSAIYQWLYTPYNMTMNLLAVAVAFGVGFIYSNNLEMKGAMSNGLVTMILFLLVCAPMQTVALADGGTMTVLDTSYMGGTGLFPALVIGLISIRIIYICRTKNLILKMPDTVPQFLQDSFNSLIPLIVNVVLWHGLNTVLQLTVKMSLADAIINVLAIPMAALNSWPGMFVLILLAMILWCFGIHGTMIAMTPLLPVMIQVIGANAAHLAAGEPLEIQPICLFGAMAVAGGTGNVLSLAVLCLRSKSQQLKAVGKAGIIPAFFNISEPMAFGVPIMYNPLIAIPFILNPIVIGLILLPLYFIGIIRPGVVFMMTVLPMFMADYVTSLNLGNLLIPVIAFVVSYIMYLPFVRAYDKQLCAQEAEQD